jgi:hypothetical protein
MHIMHEKNWFLQYDYKIKLKQSNFERNAKKILGFEHFSISNT